MYSKEILGKTLAGGGSPKFVETALQAKWDTLAHEATPEGWNLQAYLGAAVGTPATLPAGQSQTYERGIIVVRKTGGSFAIYGELYAQYYRLGGPTGFLGLPLSDNLVIGGGRCAHFDGGDIYWSPGTGARSIHGAIRARWLALGGATSGLGFPTSDESPIMRSGYEIGRFNTFANGGGIYWSAATGAWDVHGAIAGLWTQTYGGASGALGLPLSGETNTPDAGGRYNEFEHGIVVWHPDGGYTGTFALFDLEFFLAGFESDWGSYHVQVKVDAQNPATSCETWYPSASDYTSNPSVQQTIVTIPVVKAATFIDVWMDGLGDHTFGVGSDERLGIFQTRYDITNLWGILESSASHPVNQNVDSGHHLNCNFSLKTNLPLNPNLPFREQYFWPFVNFDTAEMSNQTYAQTFGDVHESESTLWHPFDALFYELVYKGVGKHGNCFGMCLEALYAIADRSLFSEPIYNNPAIRYRSDLADGKSAPNPVSTPDDARFTAPINIKHGYQLGDRVIGYFLEEFVAGHTHDPVNAFQRSRAAFAAGDRPIISIMQDATFGSGHALLPYAWDDSKLPWTMHVANPNDPYGAQSNDDAAVCTIVVDPHANTYAFVMGYNGDGSPDTWSGGDSSGGRMFHVPFSIVNSEPNTPTDDVLALISSAAFVILGGDGKTTQITDERGRTFVGTPAPQRIPNFTDVPSISAPDVLRTVPGQLDRNPVRYYVTPSSEMYCLRRPPLFPAASHPNVAIPKLGTTIELERSPLPLESSSQALSFVGGDADLTWEIAPTGSDPYVWALRSPAGSVVATVAGGGDGKSDVIHVAGAVRSLPAVTLRANGSAKTAAVTLVGPVVAGIAQARVFELTGVPVAAGAGVTLQLADGGNALTIVNAGSDAAIGVRMQSGADAARSVSRTIVAKGASTVLTISPADWSAASIAKASVTVKELDKIGGTVVKQTIV